MNASAKERVVVIDALRVFASIQMVQGHTIDALLDPRFAQGRAYEVWSYLRGLTSVAFLFAAGLAFYLTTLADIDAHLSKPGAVRHRYTRALLLIGIGYALHLPRPFFIADILQCIGLSLLFLETLVVLCRRSWLVIVGALAASIGMLTLAPASSHWIPSGTFAFVTAYFTQRGGSIFPLTPWADYLMLGVACGAFVLREANATSRQKTAVRLSVATAAAFLMASATKVLDRHDSPAMNVSFSLQKLALVVLLTAILAWSTVFVARLPRWLEALAGETLSIYVVHLLVLYGAGVGLTYLVGHVLMPFTAISAALTMCAISAAAGLGSWKLKQCRAQKKVDSVTGVR